VLHTVQTNAVFAKIADAVVDEMYKRGWKFYTTSGSEGELA